MRFALALTVIGALDVFAVSGTHRLSWLPWLNLHAAGWVLLITGASFGLAMATPHYHRWRTRRIEEDD